ncbi:MAG: DUF2723 domain-containing protein [Deltaproteobacteria bacterium]|jgi:hypothetical protein|nr:DUF2723 domain-containing protein [Deltaproteobacteria bacterium]MBW2537266.1 DUF2723 domain-containing protein [Deltaproteobacteria bacterium]
MSAHQQTLQSSTASATGEVAAGGVPQPAHGARSYRGAYLLLALGLIAVYAVTLAPGATFSDGPEITVAIHTLGVIHPTGYPLFTMVAHGFARMLAVPLPVIVKVEVFNLLCGLGSALLVARITRSVLVGLRDETDRADMRRIDLAAVAAGWFVGVSPLLWGQVRIPEVYAFQMLLVCCAGWAWTRFEHTRHGGYAVLAALPMGMGLAHHVTMVYMLPAAFLYLLIRKPYFFVAWLAHPVILLVRCLRRGFLDRVDGRAFWAFPVACVVGALPLGCYYYLIWANGTSTGVTWGDVHDWDSLYAHATGRQYQRFLELKELDAYWRRIQALPVVFDKQFLPAGTALFFSGIVALFRRRARYATFLMAYLLLNAAHGVYYAVGDYGNYLIPAELSCAVFIGAGLWWALGFVRRVPAGARLWTFWLSFGAMAEAAALSVLFYAKRTKRLPADLAEAAPAWMVLPLGIVGVAAVVYAMVAYWRNTQPRRPLPSTALPKLVLAALALTLLAATAVRGRGYYRETIIGESYGQEIAESIPAGSVFLTQGDGFLFSMWYQHHVHGRGTDFITLDGGNLKTQWYQRYLYDRYPRQCDPLRPEFLEDPARYRDQCGTYAKRIERARSGKSRSGRTYASLGLRRGRKKPHAAKLTVPVVRGNDPQCEDEGWRRDHHDQCRCYLYGKKPGVVEEDCFHSAEEGGIAPRWPIEVLTHRIIEDVIRERYVFERNHYTRWVKSLEENKRLWDGPAYQRLPGQYAMINRGRFNQIVFHADASRLPDPCSLEQGARIPLRPLEPPGTARVARYRETALPNDRPVLLKASYLTALARGTDDDASRHFQAGDSVYVKIHWFERHHYDPDKEDKRGEPIREGMRVCFFDPEGERLKVQEIISGKPHPTLKLGTDHGYRDGSYTVQACSIGAIDSEDLPLPADRPCTRIVLEYDFVLTSPQP